MAWIRYTPWAIIFPLNRRHFTLLCALIVLISYYHFSWAQNTQKYVLRNMNKNIYTKKKHSNIQYIIWNWMTMLTFLFSLVIKPDAIFGGHAKQKKNAQKRMCKNKMMMQKKKERISLLLWLANGNIVNDINNVFYEPIYKIWVTKKKNNRLR